MPVTPLKDALYWWLKSFDWAWMNMLWAGKKSSLLLVFTSTAYPCRFAWGSSTCFPSPSSFQLNVNGARAKTDTRALREPKDLQSILLSLRAQAFCHFHTRTLQQKHVQRRKTQCVYVFTQGNSSVISTTLCLCFFPTKRVLIVFILVQYHFYYY